MREPTRDDDYADALTFGRVVHHRLVRQWNRGNARRRNGNVVAERDRLLRDGGRDRDARQQDGERELHGRFLSKERKYRPK